MKKLIPHKHAEAIKAWADGASIECRCRPDQPWNGDWMEGQDPMWDTAFEYRVKPNTIQYRLALRRISNTDGSLYEYTITAAANKDLAHGMEGWGSFVRWLGDWVEVELPDEKS